MSKTRLSAAEYVAGLKAGDRMILSRAITLVESTLASDQQLAAEVLAAVMPHTGAALRIGLTGVPGVGKSTFIDAFGTYLTAMGKQVAVLACDPSSKVSKGSILGDKTRMERLSRDPGAFIRPSPTSASLGGVTRRTRESMLLCEAAGFDIIVVETVGVGQSETAVRSMVDFFLLLMLPGAGDELQGIKKGIMEMADAVVINKADGENLQRAKLAKANYLSAMKLFAHTESGWVPPVTTCSALEGTGMAEVWAAVSEYRKLTMESGWHAKFRARQRLDWLHETIRHLLEDAFFKTPEIAEQVKVYESQVLSGAVPATVAARDLVRRFWRFNGGEA